MSSRSMDGHESTLNGSTSSFPIVKNVEKQIENNASSKTISNALNFKAGFNGEMDPNIVFVGISPGNSFYFHFDCVERLFCSILNTFHDLKQIIIWIPVELYIHSLRAIGSSDPHQKALKANKKLSLILVSVIEKLQIQEKVVFLDWSSVVTSSHFLYSLGIIQRLYLRKERFRNDCLKSILLPLTQLSQLHGRSEMDIDSAEGILYLNGELACLLSLSSLNSENASISFEKWKKHVDIGNVKKKISSNTSSSSPTTTKTTSTVEWSKVAIIYHKQWELLQDFLNGKFEEDGSSSTNLSYWTID